MKEMMEALTVLGGLLLGCLLFGVGMSVVINVIITFWLWIAKVLWTDRYD